MTKIKEKEPTQKAKRNELRTELRKNIDLDNMAIRQRRPWTFVEFDTWHRGGRKNGHVDIGIWGVSKICWPDQVWNDKKGIDVAIERALAWAVREIIPPLAE